MPTASGLATACFRGPIQGALLLLNCKLSCKPTLLLWVSAVSNKVHNGKCSTCYPHEAKPCNYAQTATGLQAPHSQNCLLATPAQAVQPTNPLIGASPTCRPPCARCSARRRNSSASALLPARSATQPRSCASSGSLGHSLQKKQEAVGIVPSSGAGAAHEDAHTATWHTLHGSTAGSRPMTAATGRQSADRQAGTKSGVQRAHQVGDHLA